MFGGEIIIERLARLNGMGLAALVACHRVRVASPEVLQRLRWRYWALPGAPPFIHSATLPPPTPPPRRLRASAAVVEVLRMGVAGAVACHRVMGRDGLLVPQAVEFNFRRYKPLDSDPSPL